MSSMDTDQFLAELKLRTFIPTSQRTMTDADMLSFASREQTDKVYQYVIRQHEDFYITTTDVDMTSVGTTLRVPSRANNQTIRDVQYIDTAGNLREIPVTSMDREAEYQHLSTTRPAAYYIIGNNIQLLPSNANFQGTLRIRYAMTPNKLVATSRVGNVVSFTANSVTLDSVPNNITVGSNIDIITNKNGNETLYFDIEVDSIVTNTISFTPSIEGVVAGDWVTTAGESAVVQTPESARDFLIERTAYRIFTAWGRSDKAQESLLRLQDMENEVTQSVSNRLTEPVKMIRKNSFLRRNRRRFGTSVVRN